VKTEVQVGCPRPAMAELDVGTTFIPALHKPSALLPIAKHREALLYTIETHSVTIVVGQTGSGKSTQIPQFLYQSGWCADGKVVGITQVGRVCSDRWHRTQLLMAMTMYLAPSCCGNHSRDSSC
jgi:hypothetical protein